MLEENKNLLLTDLCARLPYGVKCYIEFDDGKIFLGRTLMPIMIQDFKSHECLVIKPYLRPISNMTEEEKEERASIVTAVYNGEVIDDDFINVVHYMDWLNAHHFDYRNLIEKGLAIEVTKENNPYED